MGKLKSPTFILFGAGATRGAFSERPVPPPVDKDFFEIVGHLKGHGTPNLTKKVLGEIWSLYGSGLNIGLESYYRDIETRAVILKFAKSANQPKQWGRRQKDLEELIRRTLIQTTCESNTFRAQEPLRSEAHEIILAKLAAGDTIATFNYDMVIEESFLNANLWNPVDGYGDTVSGVTKDWCRLWLQKRNVDTNKQNKKSKIKLLKLHGSINWTLYNNKKIKLKDRPYYVRSRRQKALYEEISILPPGWNKRIDKNPYKRLWKEMRRTLQNCKTLVIIGYSLPETDLLARALIFEAVRLRKEKKNMLHQIHIVDPNPEVVQKLMNIFSPCIGKTTLIYRYGGGIAEFAKSCG